MLQGGLPCQDASGTRVAGDRVLLAVSDGHGGEAYVHADEGARIAVRVALEALNGLMDHLTGAPNRHDPEALGLEHGPALVRRIAWEWNRRVKHHARMLRAMQGQEAPEGPGEPVSGDWSAEVRPYGATLVAAAFEPDLAVWLRLGDGDLLAVDASGARRVFPGADKTLGQATFSLCSREWVNQVEWRFEVPTAELVVLTTDGVSDPYGADPSLEEEWGIRLRERILRDGWVEAALALPRWLGQVARDGDDCSVALAWFGSGAAAERPAADGRSQSVGTSVDQEDRTAGPTGRSAPSVRPEDRTAGPLGRSASSVRQEDRTAGPVGPSASSVRQEDRTAGPLGRSASSVRQEDRMKGPAGRSASSVPQEDRTAGPLGRSASSVPQEDRTAGPLGRSASSVPQEDTTAGPVGPSASSVRQEDRTAGPLGPSASSVRQEDPTAGPLGPSRQEDPTAGPLDPSAGSVRQEDPTARRSG